MQIISTAEAPRAIGPYSQAIVINGWVHTSGQIPLTPSGDKITGSLTDQTEQVFNNLEAILKNAGCSLREVVSVTVYMTDLAEFASMNEVFSSRFGDHHPARSTVQVVALPTGARVEISAIARLSA